MGEALTDYEPIQEMFVGSSNLSTDGTLMNVHGFQLQVLKPSVLASCVYKGNYFHLIFPKWSSSFLVAKFSIPNPKCQTCCSTVTKYSRNLRHLLYSIFRNKIAKNAQVQIGGPNWSGLLGVLFSEIMWSCTRFLNDEAYLILAASVPKLSFKIQNSH